MRSLTSFQDKIGKFFLATLAGLVVTRLLAMVFFAVSVKYPQANQQLINDSFHHYYLGLLLVLIGLFFVKVKKSYVLAGFGLGIVVEELAVLLDDLGFEGYRFYYLNGIDFILILSALVISGILVMLWQTRTQRRF